ncbi:DOPA-like domain-containing protein [Russula compacta]|nr:DOPA-like domain-containing protein [Russula compacta]
MSPQVDLQDVLQSEIKEWHFHIYFHQKNKREVQAASDFVTLSLRLRQGRCLFVAVPLWRVNLGPEGPHPAGSYEIWCPSESFASVFSYLCMNRGELSVLVHPLTKEEVRVSFFRGIPSPPVSGDHETRNAWLGPSFPLDLSALPVKSKTIPLQYASLKLGYSSKVPPLSPDARRQLGANVERILEGETGGWGLRGPEVVTSYLHLSTVS